MARVDEYNRDIRGWSADTKRALKLKVAQLTSKYSGHGYNDQKVRVGNYAGEASKISFNFPYYMVFVHKGAGKGYGGNITGNFFRGGGTDKNGKYKTRGTTNPLSMGRMGTGKRKAAPWYNPTIDERFPILADLIANYKGDATFLKMQKILIR